MINNYSKTSRSAVKHPGKMKKSLLATAIGLTALAPLANAVSVDELEQQVLLLQKEIKEIKDEQKSVRKSKGAGITLYGSLRPALTYSDDDRTDSSSTDITDFLSRVGIKGERKINSNLTAFFQGEWDVDLEGDGDFGDARIGLVGFKGDWGKVAIGRQWNPHFNIVAEVTDIFHHRSSPFGYDEQGPFRTNNMVTYSNSWGGFKIDTGIQVNGDPDSSNGGDASATTEPSHIDSGSFGAAYSNDIFYVGASYLEQRGADNFERTFISFGGSVNIGSRVYLAVTYQDIETESDTLVDDLEGDSLDLVGSVDLGGDYKLKAAYFTFDDDIDDASSRELDGYNLTLEKHLNDDIRVFVEWLNRDFDQTDEVNTLSVGVRYDFSTNI